MRTLASVAVIVSMLAAPLAVHAAPVPAARPSTQIAKRGWVAPALGFATALAAKGAHLATQGQSLALGAGVAAGVYVTQKLHKSTGFWGRRIPGTRMRVADLPVGGTVAFIAAALTWRHPELSHLLIASGVGMTAGAVGTGLADPLPKK